MIGLGCDGRMAHAVRTGVTVLDFKRGAHHSLSVMRRNLIYLMRIKLGCGYNKCGSANSGT